jgi:hypothetical protein
MNGDVIINGINYDRADRSDPGRLIVDWVTIGEPRHQSQSSTTIRIASREQADRLCEMFAAGAPVAFSVFNRTMWPA